MYVVVVEPVQNMLLPATENRKQKKTTLLTHETQLMKHMKQILVHKQEQK